MRLTCKRRRELKQFSNVAPFSSMNSKLPASSGGKESGGCD
jgi:hypothetical protein